MPYHPKKPYHLCRKSVAPDPLVDPGNPPHRHQARPPARSARPHHRMVVVAACPPGPSSSCPSQAGIPHKKNATVMLTTELFSSEKKRADPFELAQVAELGRFLDMRPHGVEHAPQRVIQQCDLGFFSFG